MASERHGKASSGDAGQSPVDSKEKVVMRVPEIEDGNGQGKWREDRDCHERNGSG